ncbi:leucine-rich repeat domain-containing protein [bacterium]|nr:leucine-rich repeat domain-containing protein [bacterium]
MMNEEAMQKALRECVKRLGTEILTDKTRFRGVIHDMLPGLNFKTERNLLIIAADNFSIGENLLKAPTEAEARERVFHYLVKEMTDGGLQQEAAETVLRSFAVVVGWNIKSAGGAHPQPSSGSGLCAHRSIDFSVCSCRDCGAVLYGLFEGNKYTPYESMLKKEKNGVLFSIDESYGGTFVIPEHITALDEECLADHAGLQSVILPSSLRTIGSYAFENCSSLKKLKAPESVSEIGVGAFKGLKRVYYNGPAAGSPWGAREHVASVTPVVNPPVVPTNLPGPTPKPSSVQSGTLASLRAVYANKRVGERFEFGRYPQGENGEVKPIKWRVLRRDSDALLVISEYGLDAKPYNEKFETITWSACTLRRWLNGEFLQKAFSAQEQSLIKVSSLPNNAGPSTDDCVFLLSINEAESLFANDSDRIIKSTAYAIKRGTQTYCGVYAGNTWWWLRSRGSYDSNAADVSADGYIDDDGVNNASAAVRPAFRIAI